MVDAYFQLFAWFCSRCTSACHPLSPNRIPVTATVSNPSSFVPDLALRNKDSLQTAFCITIDPFVSSNLVHPLSPCNLDRVRSFFLFVAVLEKKVGKTDLSFVFSYLLPTDVQRNKAERYPR